jgi:hypothetical protein
MSAISDLQTQSISYPTLSVPLSEAPRFFAVDEIGYFPANYVVDPQICRNPRMRRMAADGTLRKMILNVDVSNDPEDIEHRSLSTKALTRHRDTRCLEYYEGYKWAELNGIHSKQPELVLNSYRTRKAGIVLLLRAAGFTGAEGQRAIVDPFWDFSRTERAAREVEEFYRAFEFFGIPTGAVIFPDEAERRYILGNHADADAYRIFVDPLRNNAYGDRKVELSPKELLDCVRYIGPVH